MKKGHGRGLSPYPPPMSTPMFVQISCLRIFDQCHLSIYCKNRKNVFCFFFPYQRYCSYDVSRRGHRDDVLFPSRSMELRNVLVRVFFMQHISVRYRTDYDMLFIYNAKMTSCLFFSQCKLQLINFLYFRVTRYACTYIFFPPTREVLILRRSGIIVLLYIRRTIFTEFVLIAPRSQGYYLIHFCLLYLSGIITKQYSFVCNLIFVKYLYS